MSSHEAFRDAVAAYALDALDAEERGPFEAHLATCAECQRELAELRRVTAGLGLSVDPIAPPESLKARTLARATAQSQRARSAAAIREVEPKRSFSWQWLAAAASVVLIVGLSMYAALLRSEVTRLSAAASEAYARADSLREELMSLRRDSVRLMNAVSVLSAPDTIKVDLRASPAVPQASGRAYLSAGRGLVFAANRLPALLPGRVYQLWVIAPDSAVPVGAGVFAVDAAGSSSAFAVVLPAGMERVKTVAVTDEPGPSGSLQPSTPILLAGSAD